MGSGADEVKVKMIKGFDVFSISLFDIYTYISFTCSVDIKDLLLLINLTTLETYGNIRMVPIKKRCCLIKVSLICTLWLPKLTACSGAQTR